MNREEVIKVVSKGGSLAGAGLRCIDLSGVDLSGINLSGAKLRCVNLKRADLSSADLSGANLQDADLSSANLNGVDLYGADLSNANLIGANLRNTELRYANLNGTDLTGAKGPLIEFRRGKVVTEPLIGYKKCRDNVIVTLEIPEGATVFSINGHKCRTNKVKVAAIDGADRGISHYNHMSYYVGDVITINDFDLRYNIECATGIHFFMNRKDAENYIF